MSERKPSYDELLARVAQLEQHHQQRAEQADALDVVADRRSVILIGFVAVWSACLIFAVLRLVVTLQTGLLTPWWGNAAGLVALTALYAWYRRGPKARSAGAAHGISLVATLALLIPIAYGMISTIWWLSLVGFAGVLLGRRQEAKVWGVTIPLLVVASVIAAPYVQIQGAAGEPLLEAAAAKIVFVVILISMAMGFRRVAEQRASALHDSEAELRQLKNEFEARALSGEGLASSRLEELGRLNSVLQRSEQRLQQQAAELEAVFNAQTESVIVHDTDGVVTRANAAACATLGFDPTGQRPGQNMMRAGTPGGESSSVTARALQGETIAGAPLDYAGAEGQRRTVWASSAPMRNEEGRIVGAVTVSHDITDRKLAEEALGASLQSLARAQRLAHVGDWEVDVRTGKATWSDEAFRMLGIEPGSTRARPEAFLELVHPEDRKAAEKIFVEAASGRLPHVEYEVRIIRPNGEERRLFIKVEASNGEDGKPARLFGVNLDITERTRAQHALEASELRYRRLFEAAKDGILILDAETGRIVDVNPFLITLTGYSRQDFLGKHLWEIGPFKDVAASKRQFAELQTNDYVRYEDLPLEAADGRRVDVEFVSNVYRLDQEKVIQCNVRDISARKRAAEAIHQAEEEARRLSVLLQRTFDAIPDLLTVQDRDLRVVLSNWHGRGHVTPEERSSKPLCYSCYMRRTQPCETCPTLEVFRTGAAVTTEVANPFTGRVLEVNAYPVTDASGTVGLVTEHVRDITERRRDQEALRESELRFRGFFDNAPIGTSMTAPDGRLTLVNPALAAMLGYSVEELSTLSFAAITHPDDLAETQESLRSMLAGERDTWSTQKRYLAKDGRTVWTQATTRLVRDARNEPLHFLTHVQDITERRRSEAERERLHEQLRMSQKMEAIGSLAGGVAHDFNNLLSVILSYTGFAMEGLREGDPLRDDLQEVKQAGERAAALTRQLLAFSRKQVLQPVPLNLNQIAAGIEKMLRRILGEDIDLVQVLAPDLGMIRADEGQIEQVVMNLVVNARDAMPQGGKLTIETANVDLDDGYAAQHIAVKPGPYVQLVVTDTGCGMDEQTKDRVFEPFFTTKEKGKGTGLGLSTVYGIVKQSGGNIWVYSEPGQGTSFKIYLPRAPDATATATERRRLPRLARGTETILVVEDEEALRKVTVRTLGAAGYKVLSAANGGEALLTCSQHTGDLELLLTDVVMPRMSGRVLAEELVKIRPTLKVLYMSGYTDDAIVHHGVLEAGTHFLAKPFSAADLTAKVREVLDDGLSRPDPAAGRDGEVDGDATR